MRALILSMLALLVMSCTSRKVELQKEIDKLKIETSEKQEVIDDLQMEVETSKSESLALSELVTAQQNTFASKVQELTNSYQSSLEEQKENFYVDSATGVVKVSDTKGNNYEIPSGAGTIISKSSDSKLISEVKEQKATIKEQSQTITLLQTEIAQLSDINETQSMEIDLLSKSNTEKKQETKSIEKSKDKETERQGVSLWHLLWGVPLLLAIGEFGKPFKNLWRLIKPKIHTI